MSNEQKGANSGSLVPGLELPTPTVPRHGSPQEADRWRPAALSFQQRRWGHFRARAKPLTSVRLGLHPQTEPIKLFLITQKTCAEV